MVGISVTRGPGIIVTGKLSKREFRKLVYAKSCFNLLCIVWIIRNTDSIARFKRELTIYMKEKYCRGLGNEPKVLLIGDLSFKPVQAQWSKSPSVLNWNQEPVTSTEGKLPNKIIMLFAASDHECIRTRPHVNCHFGQKLPQRFAFHVSVLCWEHSDSSAIMCSSIAWIRYHTCDELWNISCITPAKLVVTRYWSVTRETVQSYFGIWQAGKKSCLGFKQCRGQKNCFHVTSLL